MTLEDWKTRTLVAGTALGALIGLGTAYLMVRTADEHGGEPPKITTGEAIRTAIGIVGIVRGIAALGDRR
jgi:hypothetical protein